MDKRRPFLFITCAFAIYATVILVNSFHGSFYKWNLVFDYDFFFYLITIKTFRLGIIYIILLISTLFAIRNGNRERLIWAGVAFGFISLLPSLVSFQTLFHPVISVIFVIWMLTLILSIKRQGIEFVSLREKDDKTVIWWFIIYALIVLIPSLCKFIGNGYSAEAEDFESVFPIDFSYILYSSLGLSCISYSFIGYLLVRRLTWGYILSVVLLLSDYDHVFSLFNLYSAACITKIVNGSDLKFLEPIQLITTEVNLSLMQQSLNSLRGFVAVCLAIFILRRMREKPIQAS
jgi:hypothetical protein